MILLNGRLRNQFFKSNASTMRDEFRFHCLGTPVLAQIEISDFFFPPPDQSRD